MAWSTPLTATASTALTAAQWNASVRDNLLHLKGLFDTLPVRMAAGTIVVTLTAESFNFTAISFPASRFTVAPIVTCTLQTAPGGTAKFVARAISMTTTGALVYCYTGDSTSVTGNAVVGWQAIQMTASTAAG